MRFTMLLLTATGVFACVIGAVASTNGYRHDPVDQVATAVYVVGALLCCGLLGLMLGVERLIAQREPAKVAPVVVEVKN